MPAPFWQGRENRVPRWDQSTKKQNRKKTQNFNTWSIQLDEYTETETSPNLSPGLCTILTFRNTWQPLKVELNVSQLCVFSGNISWGSRGEWCPTRTLVTHLSCGLPSFSSSHSLVLSPFRLNSKPVKREGGVSPCCLWNDQHRSASVLPEYFRAHETQ